ncbi:RrF2 family transcriptional regulator [Rhizobium sp. SL86]|uniref:RrF2 family transcriptional regulator n=1 Tax=Rhizobium sp. SL86 TaxID=2995148 RepID=UPI002275E2C6|nr:Rrf2 family transcriptional regulator [Rhizobium sp. SL86]MCY1666330.1 Rrf2 family transcriptional regulator [Rhizobium sp. SL86]
MRLTRQSEIAIAILTACAQAAGKTVRTMDVAEAAKATKDHAAQIVTDLVQQGLLKAMRGRQGGITLARPPEEILLGDVLRRMQPDLVRHTEARNSAEPPGANTAFTAIVGAAEATFFTFMDRFSIADLVSEIASRRVDCLDCALLNPAHRKRDTAPLYHQDQPVSDPHDEAGLGLILAERARGQRNQSPANTAR